MDKMKKFIDAQDRVYSQVLTELRAEKKQSHWMWFIFPQHRDLGHSSTAKKFGLDGIPEASLYLHDELLNKRLRECCEILANCESDNIQKILGSPDNLKLRSSLTLFYNATTDEQERTLFKRVLEKYYEAIFCERTLRLIGVQ
ncbi:MAG: DUF1810 domain-containing protein [Turicibacter sp.]|nr:DUF1810 domain-containing protein [Turicibacter sp.]